jgi:hypothetical protein
VGPALDPAAPDPETAYYQGVEEFFVSRRGDPLFLSNADWLLIRKWRKAGIPLRVVLRGIADALDTHAHSWGRAGKVGSLAYCAHEVEAATDRWRRSLAFGGASGVDATSVLLGFAARLEAASGLGAAARRLVPDLAREMRDRAAASSIADVERWLAVQEKKLLAALERDLGPETVARAEAEAEAVLAPYRARMPPRILQQIRKESITLRLLEIHGLPRLSLFHAAGGPERAGAD